VRTQAAQQLAQFQVQRSVAALAALAATDRDATVRATAVTSLGIIGHESVFASVLGATADEAREVRAAAARALSRLSFDRADAYVRVIEAGDETEMRRLAHACINAGLATKALDRLARSRSLATPKRRPLPVYLTEFGYFASGKRAMPESRRAKYLPKAFAIAQKDPHVRQMLHYGLVAPPATQSGAAFDFGLLLADGSRRPAYGPLAAWAAKAMSKRRIAVPGGPIALPPAQPNADPPGEPPPEPCMLLVAPCP
jgi:hypothetical protein